MTILNYSEKFQNHEEYSEWVSQDGMEYIDSRKWGEGYYEIFHLHNGDGDYQIFHLHYEE